MSDKRPQRNPVPPPVLLRQERAELATLKHTVLPAEVDGFQVVHFSNYLRWFSGALMVLFEKTGLGAGRFDGGTVEIRVGRVQMAYCSSARLNDKVSISVQRAKMSDKDMQIWVRASRNGEMLARGRLTIAFVNSKTGSLTRIPGEVVQALGQLQKRVA